MLAFTNVELYTVRMMTVCIPRRPRDDLEKQSTELESLTVRLHSFNDGVFQMGSIIEK